jgi:hypothetical protein
MSELVPSPSMVSNRDWTIEGTNIGAAITTDGHLEFEQVYPGIMEERDVVAVIRFSPDLLITLKTILEVWENYMIAEKRRVLTETLPDFRADEEDPD